MSMLKHEFEDRIGRKVSNAEYEDANAMYELAGDMDKDEFCRQWREIGNYSLVKNLFESAYHRGNRIDEYKLMVNEQQSMLKRVVDEIVENIKTLQEFVKGGCTSDEIEMIIQCLHETAVNTMGQKYVVLGKVRIGAQLTEDEVELVEKSL